MKGILTLLALVAVFTVSAQQDSVSPVFTDTTVVQAKTTGAASLNDSTVLKEKPAKDIRQVRSTAKAKAAQPVRERDTTHYELQTDTITPHTITYTSKTIMTNAAFVYDKKNDSLIVSFRDHKIYSTMSLRPELSHLTDVSKRVRYSQLRDQKMFKAEKVNPDTTNFKYSYVKLVDTLIWHGYVGYRHKFTMKDQFTGTTYTVVLYESPLIKIDPEFAKYYFSELFFMKVPIKLTGGVIKALAEQRIDNKPVVREELQLRGFDNEAGWEGGVDFSTPMDKGYTYMLPDGSKKEKQYAKELIERLSGKKDYPTVPYRQEFDHE